MEKNSVFIVVFLLVSVVQSIDCDISLGVNDISLELYEKTNITLRVRNLNTTVPQVLAFVPQHADIVKIVPDRINLTSTDDTIPVEVDGTAAGHSVVNTTLNNQTLKDVFLRVTVKKSEFLDKISLAIGWLYFVAWSVSFYPQIYSNWERKSVVGLNFDFLALNVVGFTLYGIFNLGLYFIPEIQAEYFSRYPRGVNPVQVNDIVFALHAAAACVLTIIQCFFYERDEQRVSTTARGILGIFFTFLMISIVLAAKDVIHWLDFLYYCSYVKLTITLIKYVPQAYMNYKRKSTVGWSIGNIFLDFTGGILSMLQMILNSYNYDDWVSIFGDPTKFGLGLFSVVFDIFFIIQHYVLYRHTKYEIRLKSNLNISTKESSVYVS